MAISGLEKAGQGRGVLGTSGVLISRLLAGFSVCAGALAAVPANTNSAVLTWAAPTTNVDGSALADLIGFNIYHGTSPTAMMMAASLAATASSYSESNLTPAVWYWYVTAVNAVGTESAPSPMVSQTVTAPTPTLAPTPPPAATPSSPASPAKPTTPAPPVAASPGGSAQPPASTADPWQLTQFSPAHRGLCRPRGEVWCFINH